MAAIIALHAVLSVVVVKGKMMKSNLKVIFQETPSDDDELVKKLMEDPVVKAHCQELEVQGIDYKVIPIRSKQLSNK